ncbi:MAG: porin [Polaromonas sp.]|nr:porin [Polaromonas sp.]
MKKSLIALAVLASSGAAMAQSSVTLYGLVDAAVAHTSATDAAGNKTNQNRVESSGANNSRWGLKGTEDLGNGLKANFVLEAGFNTDTGTDAQTVGAAGTAFGRQAFVGLSGDFGAVTLGRQYTAYDALRAATNNLYDTNVATTNTVWGNAVAGYANRVSNSIAYTSPVFSGVSGAAVVALGEDKSNTNPVSQNNSLHIKYANGPVLAGYAFQEEKTGTTTSKYNLLAGSYDFGVAKLTGGFNMAKQGTAKDKEFQVGVSAPVGAAATVAAGYSYSKGQVAGVTTVKGSGLSLLGTYSLSKRTTAYAGLNAMKFKDGADNTTGKSSMVAVGVRHTF